MPSRPAPRARLRAAERREQLLDVTKALVGEEGLHAVSLEAVARRAGVTRPLIYGHFTSLQGLLEALLKRETARALEQLSAVLQGAAPGEDRRAALLAALQAYLEAVRADPVTWRLVLLPPEGAPSLLRDRVAQGRQTMVALLAALVSEGLGPGRTSPDPALTAHMLSTLSEEAARLLLTDPETYPVRRLIRYARWLLEQLGEGTPVPARRRR